MPKSCGEDCTNNFNLTGCLDLWNKTRDKYKPIIIGGGMGVFLLMVIMYTYLCVTTLKLDFLKNIVNYNSFQILNVIFASKLVFQLW